MSIWKLPAAAAAALASLVLGDREIVRDSTYNVLRVGDGLTPGGCIQGGVLPDRAAMKLFKGGMCVLAEGKRRGTFTFDPTVDPTVHQADPLEGIYVAPVANAKGAWVRNDLGMGLNVQWWGAKGDGKADDTAAIQAALDTAAAQVYTGPSGNMLGQVVFAPRGVYLVSATVLVGTGVNFNGNDSLMVAKAASVFEYVMTATGKSRVIIERWQVDVNHPNRSATQQTRMMGIGLLACTDSRIDRCSVTRSLGGAGGVSGVGIVAASGCVRCQVTTCTVTLAGTTALPSDGVFISGDQCLADTITATDCTDTGVVIETSNYSGMQNITALRCNAGIAITNASPADKRGNWATGVSIHDWRSEVTGGIQIGCVGGSANTGNLLDTRVEAIVSATGQDRGVGPAINIRQDAPGRVKGLALSVTVTGATQQGVLVNGDNVVISNPLISGTGSSCIQFQTGCVGGTVNGGIIRGGPFGVYSDGTAQVAITGTRSIGAATSFYADGTSTMELLGAIPETPGNARYGKGTNATINVLGTIVGDLTVTAATGSAPQGTITNKVRVFDRTGNPIGFFPVYNS